MAPASPSAGGEPGLLRLGPATASRRLVLLHGWGADADDLLELGTLLAPADASVVALQAPLPHPAGVGRQWYDLQQPGWPQLGEARRDLRQRLLRLATEIPLAHTVLLGFSQGAAMALDVATSGDGLAAEQPGLAGLVGCSGYPHPAWQPQPAGGTPVLLTHTPWSGWPLRASTPSIRACSRRCAPSSHAAGADHAKNPVAPHTGAPPG